MTRGNPRPGQQQLPDRTDDIERVAQKLEATAAAAAAEVRQKEAALLREAREAGRKAGMNRGQVGHDAAQVSE